MVLDVQFCLLLHPFLWYFLEICIKLGQERPYFILSHLPSVIFRLELNKSLKQVPESSWKWFNMRADAEPAALLSLPAHWLMRRAPLTCDPLTLAAHLFLGYCSSGLSSLIITACALHAQHAHTRSTQPRPGSVPSLAASSSVFSWWEIPSVHGKRTRAPGLHLAGLAGKL